MNTSALPPAASSSHRLRALLDARSVAVVGASGDPAKIPGRPLAYMLARGYAGALYPVNPSKAEVQGLKSYPSLAAIGHPVDLAIVGTAAAQVEGIMAEGIATGVRAFVVFSSGFAELGDQGRAMQARLSAMAREHGVAILGPNCLGVVNTATGLIASFTTALEEGDLKRGKFAFVSQSGALGAYWMDIVLRSGLGFSQWITTGNECDVDAAEAIDYLVDDPNTEVIGLYLEDVRRADAFRAALARAAAAGKPVIAIKSGRSSAGAAAAASHTGALAGDDALYDACLQQHGALRVESLSEMMDTARLFLFGAVPRGGKLAVMTVSGGAGVLIADACDSQGLSLPPFAPATLAALRPALPAFVHPANPLDITGNVVQDTASIAKAMAQDPGVDAIVLFVGMMHSIAEVFERAMSATSAGIDRPIIVVWIGATDHTVATLEAAHIPVYLDIPQAIRALANALQVRRLQQAAQTQAPAQPSSSPAAQPAISEWDGKQLLAAQAGVALPRGVLIAPGAALPSPLGLSFPVVAKLQSAQLLHKSDAGGVILKIADEAALHQAVARLEAIGQQLAIPVQGVLVEEMLPFDHELLLGLRRDARFGPVLTLARGGVEVELDADAATHLLPVSAPQVQALLEGLRAGKLFRGYRGKPGMDLPAVSAKIAVLCDWFVAQPQLVELEINPLAIQGDRVTALDALITPGV